MLPLLAVLALAAAVLAGGAAAPASAGGPGPLVLGEGSVPAPDDLAFRNNHLNAALALKLLDGARVEPGGVFSFNEAVGPRTEERGFLLGLSGSCGRYFLDVGGGVCRAATALHRAVLNAGLEVVERRAHSCPPPYAPDGDDAAVWWDAWDYRFRNSLSVPLLVYGAADVGGLHVRLVAPDFPNVREGLVFVPGLPAAVVDGKIVPLEAAPFLEEGRTWVPRAAFCRLLEASPEALAGRVSAAERDGVAYAPLRPAAEALGLRTEWIPAFRAAAVK